LEVFAKMPEIDKQAYYEFSADKKGLPKHIIEKDFWVCWTLKQLFALPDIGEQLIFKGGTSLSKAYHLIKRFSEDIDISIDKKYLGFIGERDPEGVSSNKKQQILIRELADTCSCFVQNKLKEELYSQFSRELNSTKMNWHLDIDTVDVDRQTLLFYYPTLSPKTNDTYVRSIVKIEFGARGAKDPYNICNISPFMMEEIADSKIMSSVKIKTLAAERTFWEKATILHMYANWPTNKIVPLRQSRHFFDFYKLLQSDIKTHAMDDLNLLKRVAEHKKIYFRAGWANYENAKEGSLTLIPPDAILHALENDYRQMKEMFYGHAISWSEIILQIKNFQSAFNNRD